ncbi:MAG: GIY-YIG nuclease family protein [Cyanobacteria bacterium P01_A01_bin.45]
MAFTRKQRNDNEPGYIYLIEAIGFHGIIPGKLVRRCKIGLSRNPQLRRQNFVDSQFPCNVRIVKSIWVEDMLKIETQLHQIFNFCNVELEKSREWFDLTPWQFYRCLWELRKREPLVWSLKDIPVKTIAIGLCCTIGLSSLTVMSYQKASESIQNSQTTK